MAAGIAHTISLPFASLSRAARLSSVPALRSSFLCPSSSSGTLSIRSSIAPRNPSLRVSMTLQAPEKILSGSSFLDRPESGVLHFVKYHGLGNDFILVDNRNSSEPRVTPDQATKLCDRNFGIGADGVIFAIPGTNGTDYTMRIFNSDGSEPEMCGNGVRCFARFISELENLHGKHRFTVHTGAGLIVPEIQDDGKVTVDMGEPILKASDVPTKLSPNQGHSVVKSGLEVNGVTWDVTCASMGNPHCVTFGNKEEQNLQVDKLNLAEIGPKFEHHEVFPARTNTEFVQAFSISHLKMRVWERGAGATLACGTGACAVVVAAVLEGRAGRTRTVDGQTCRAPTVLSSAPMHRRTLRATYFKSILTHIKIHTFSCKQFIEAGKSQPDITGTASSDSDVGFSQSGTDPSQYAIRLFDELPDRDVVSVSALLSRLAKSHRHREVLLLFSRMLLLCIRPNEFTYGMVIHSSIELKDVDLSRQLQACSMKMGLSAHVCVGSAVLDSYAKSGTIEDARRAFEDTNLANVVSYTTLICGYLKRSRFEDAVGVFREMPEKNIVSWNAVIGGCSQMGRNEEAVNFFIAMMREGWVPNSASFPSAVSAAANIAGLGMGRSFHACVIKCLGKPNVFSGNSLISLYAKCGSLEDSLLVFVKLKERNIVSCNAVICGFAQNGKGKEAMDFFENMQSAGFKPNSVTCLGLLWACNHVGLVDEGYSYFNRWRSERPDLLNPEHYACIVDLLSRCGLFVEAEGFITNLPFDPRIGFWKAVLGGCQIHLNFELGELAARKILALDPTDVSSYVMLSNAHSAAGRWESVSSMRKEMKKRGLVRVPGCSWIEVKSKLHVFVTSDWKHEQKEEIYMVIGVFLEHLKEMEASNLLLELIHH